MFPLPMELLAVIPKFAGVAPGSFDLLMGLYLQPSLQRLRLASGEDALRLAQITITAP